MRQPRLPGNRPHTSPQAEGANAHLPAYPWQHNAEEEAEALVMEVDAEQAAWGQAQQQQQQRAEAAQRHREAQLEAMSTLGLTASL